MKDDLSETGEKATGNGSCSNIPGNAPENANAPSGPVAVFQEKMDRWTDRVGRGAKRGFFCGLFIAWALALYGVIILIVNYLNPRNGLETDTSTVTFWSFVAEGGSLIIGYTVFITPVGVIVGAILGALGLFREKKSTDKSFEAKQSPVRIKEK